MASPQRKRASGLSLALASALAFGGSGPVARPLIEAGLDPLHVTWLRVAGTALVLSPLALRHWRAVRTHPGLLLAYGVFPMAGVQALYFAAISRIPVGVALLIEFLGPVLVLVWVRFVRRQPVSRWAAVGVVLAVSGLACLVEVWAGIRLDPVGLALASGAAVCQAGYFLLSDQGGDDVEPAAVIAFGTLIGAVLVTAFARPWLLDFSVLGQQVPFAGFEAPALALVAWVVLVATALAYLTGIAAIRRLSPMVAGGVAYLEVVTAIVLAWLLLGEELSPAQVAGAVIVVAGAFLAQMAVGDTGGPAPVLEAAVEPGRTSEGANAGQA